MSLSFEITIIIVLHTVALTTMGHYGVHKVIHKIIIAPSEITAQKNSTWKITFETSHLLFHYLALSDG